MINSAIIGYGKMGQIRHKSINKSKKFKLKAIYDPESNIDSKFSVNHLNKIYKDKDIEAVFICTPNNITKKTTIDALRNNKNIFCEKPPAIDSKDMKSIIDVEKKYNRILMYGFNHREHESIKKIKKITDSKQYGRILWMRGRYGKSVDKQFFENWRSKKKYAGGGILLDQGIHMVDILLFLAGGFDKVLSSVTNNYWDLNIEDNVFAIFENKKSKISASLHSTITQWRHLFSLEVFFERGYVTLNGLKTSTNSYGDEILTVAKNRSLPPEANWTRQKKYLFKTNKSWDNELNNFYKAIKFKKNYSANSSEAYKLMKIIDLIYKK